MKNAVASLSFLLIAGFFQLLQSQPTVGLIHADASSYGGFTLFSPNGAQVTHLVDACGRVVHSWPSDYQPGLVAYLLEDGSLLRACRLPNQMNPIGGGLIERRDWDNNLLWTFTYSSNLYRQHHDIRMMPNGNVLLLARERKSRAECIARGRDSTLLNQNGLQFEYIVEVQPVGADSGIIVWEWHLWDHLIQDFDNTKPDYGVISDYPERLNINASITDASDWIHCNAVVYNPDLDQIILNSRNQNEFWILDHNTTTAESSTHQGGAHGRGGDFLYRWGNPANYGRGTVADQQLWVQHDAHWIEPGLPGAGQILIFNNGTDRPGGDYSTVVAIQTPVDSQGDYPIASGQAWGPATPQWSYQAPVPTDFYSLNISGSQRLLNGNTHICEGASGRIFEVDTAGEIHWEYIVPLSSGSPITQGDAPTFNSTFRSYRYGNDFPAFTGRDLSPGDPIEINFLPPIAACEALEIEEISPEAIQIFPNPFENQLEIIAPFDATWKMYNVLGKIIGEGICRETQESIPLSSLASGFYFIQIGTPSGAINYKLLKK
jgi:Arylsulfotransferase (ASST)/Secretion system C-terminal sorting domain